MEHGAEDRGEKTEDRGQQVAWEIRELENWGISAFEN
jgi:hypothetical protein